MEKIGNPPLMVSFIVGLLFEWVNFASAALGRISRTQTDDELLACPPPSDIVCHSRRRLVQRCLRLEFVGNVTLGSHGEWSVTLQNVILASLGYLVLMGKRGIRIGDRIQVSGITGDVINMGMLQIPVREFDPQRGRLQVMWQLFQIPWFLYPQPLVC